MSLNHECSFFNIRLLLYITFFSFSGLKFIDFIKEGSPEDVEGSSDVQAVLQSTAKDIMTPECLTINREKTVHDLIAFIKENNLSTIPVVDDSGDLVGIVTVADIIKLL